MKIGEHDSHKKEGWEACDGHGIMKYKVILKEILIPGNYDL